MIASYTDVSANIKYELHRSYYNSDCVVIIAYKTITSYSVLKQVELYSFKRRVISGKIDLKDTENIIPKDAVNHFHRLFKLKAFS